MKPVIPPEVQYNVDDEGWALIEQYIWDIGDDEEIEKLIDKAIRILLVHPEFEKLLWKNKKELTKIYDDKSFGEVVSKIQRIILKITQEIAMEQIENTSAFSSLKLGNLKGVFGKIHVRGKSVDNDNDNSDEKEEKKVEDMTAGELYGFDEDGKSKAEKYAFWNMRVYNDLKKVFNIEKDIAKESYLWSFLLSIACCIVQYISYISYFFH